MMKLIVLGSGTCVPSLIRSSPGYYLEADGCQVLVDCGSGTLHQLERSGKSYKDIDAVFLTHKHPDHFADLMPLIHALLYTPGFNREKELLIVGPQGFKEYYNKAIDPILFSSDGFSIRIIEIIDEFDFSPFHIRSTRTVHSDDSIAYRFEYNGKSLVFTGDADYDQGLINFAENADLIVADCSFPSVMKVKGHLSSLECGLIAHKSGANKLLLSHIYPSDISDAERVNEAKENFKGDVILAEDLMKIEI